MTFSTKWLFYQALLVFVSAAMPRVMSANPWLESLVAGVIWFGFNYAHYRWVLYEDNRLYGTENPLPKQTPQSSPKNKRRMDEVSYDK